jgi:hypothetical protein
MVSRGPEVNRKQRNKDAKSICWQVTLSTTLDMLLLRTAPIIWFVTVHSGTCLFTTGATCPSHNDAYEATTVAPLCYRQNVRPCFLRHPLRDLEPRRHMVSATVLDLRRNESLHMPVFSCSAVEVKKKGRWCCSLYYFASQDECVQKCSILGSLLSNKNCMQ